VRHPQIKVSSYDRAMDELLREVEADSSTLGLVLHGSRAGGAERPGSDFDLVRVVTDEAYDQRVVHEKRAFLTAQVLVDKTGEVAGLVEAIVAKANEAAYAAVPEAYDAYLNSWVRSLKAWRRGDELGGRLHAAQSAAHLVQLLFGLEHRWPPYLDALEPALPAIEDAQGWEAGYLRAALLRLTKPAILPSSASSRRASRRSWTRAALRTNGATTSSR
jgi:hypothetical protein